MFFECVRSQGFGKQREDQTDEQYIYEFCAAIAVIPEDVWALLPMAAHEWYSNTAARINIKEEYETWPKCEGFVSIHPPVVIIQPTIGGKRGKRVAPKDSKYVGVTREARKITMLHPDWTSRVIHKYLDASGYSGVKYELISVICSECRAFILLAKDLGMWRKVSMYEKKIPKDPTEEEKQKTGS